MADKKEPLTKWAVVSVSMEGSFCHWKEGSTEVTLRLRGAADQKQSFHSGMKVYIVESRPYLLEGE